MSMGGEADSSDDKKFEPVGMRRKTCDGPCEFEKVQDNEAHIVLMQAEGHLFAFDRVESKGRGSSTEKKSYVPKPMKHGQMIITLSWGAEPSDLDLYVVAPNRHGTTHIGGAKPEHSASNDAKDEAKGVTINWMNKGNAKEYPYVELDVDAMSG